MVSFNRYNRSSSTNFETSRGLLAVEQIISSILIFSRPKRWIIHISPELLLKCTYSASFLLSQWPSPCRNRISTPVKLATVRRGTYSNTTLSLQGPRPQKMVLQPSGSPTSPSNSPIRTSISSIVAAPAPTRASHWMH